MHSAFKPPWAWALIALVSFSAIAAALISQHVFDMQPCPWCVLQRAVFAAIGLLALLGLALRSRTGTWAVALGVDALGTAGAAAALWQHFVAASSTSCNLTLADKILQALGLVNLLPEVFEPRASCAEAKVNLLGLPYEFWSLALFALLAAWALGLAMRTLAKQKRA
jgi:protein dithiol:quinone oxidoreductase